MTIPNYLEKNGGFFLDQGIRYLDFWNFISIQS